MYIYIQLLYLCRTLEVIIFCYICRRRRNMSIQIYVGVLVVLSCYVFGLWQTLHRYYVKPLLVPVPALEVSMDHTIIHMDDWNTLIKDQENYYAQDIVELSQFRKTLRKAGANRLLRKKLHPVKRLEHYRYNINSACDEKGITIVIDELYHAIHTHGGSSFRVVATSATLRQVCSFHDFFNGTYVAFCLMDQNDCINVTIYVMYVEFTAYTRKLRPENKFLWRRNICSRSCNATIPLQFLYPPIALQKRVVLQNRMTWWMKNGTLQLFIRNTTSKTWNEYQPISKPDLCRSVYTQRWNVHVNNT